MSTFRDENMTASAGSADDQADSLDCLKSAILAQCLLVQSQLDASDSAAPLLLNRNSLKKLFKNLQSPSQRKLLIATLDELNESYRIDKYLKCLTHVCSSSLVYFFFDSLYN